MITTNEALFGFILTVPFFSLGWYYYFRTFSFWKRKGFWEKYTWIGFIVMQKRMKSFDQLGKIYALRSTILLNVAPVVLVVYLLLVNFVIN